MPANPLENIVPAPYRKTVYAVLSLAALIFGIYQATEGDWGLFVASVLTSLTTGTAASNTNAE